MPTDPARLEKHVRPSDMTCVNVCDRIVLVVVVRVGFPAHRKLCKWTLLPGGEQDPNGKIVDMGGTPTGTRGDGGLWVAAVELLEVSRSWLIVACPCFVSTAYVAQLALVGLRSAQHKQLGLQGLVLAPPHLM